MKVDVFEGGKLGPDFQHVGPRGDQRADERRCVAIAVWQSQNNGAIVNRGGAIEGAGRTKIRGSIA